MVMCYPDVERWGPLVTTAARIGCQTDHDAWRTTATYGPDDGREVAGDQVANLFGDVVATPLVITTTAQSLILLGDRSGGRAQPVWGGDGGQRRAFYVRRGRLTLDHVEISGWQCGDGDAGSQNGGGAIFVQYNEAGLVATEVRFVGNSATYGGSSNNQWPKGGAIRIADNDDRNPTIRLVDCDFVDNTDRAGNVAVFWKAKHHVAGEGGQCYARADENWYQRMHGGADCNHYDAQHGSCDVMGWCLPNGEDQSFYYE